MSGETRIGDAEREGAAAALGDHYAAGRLDHEEYTERLDAIWTARTRADLDLLFHDLPRLVTPAPPTPRRDRGRLPFPVVALLVLLVGGLVLTHLPLFLLLIGVVLLVRASRHSGRLGCRSSRRSPASRW
jgi:uncharacterized protein DUF1707